MMITITILSTILGSITLISSFVIIRSIYLHKKFKRGSIWQSATNTQLVTRSAPISRRSSSILVDLGKISLSSRSRSASFSEDLSARLQILTSNNCYDSYSPIKSNSTVRSTRSSLTTNTRLPSVSNSSSTVSTSPSVTFQLRYENPIETLYISLFQIQNYLPKNNQNIFCILYLLPNDDEQRQTQLSTNGIFNECFEFSLKPNDLLKRTLRLTVYTVDSITRIRNILGHIFVKFDKFMDETTDDKTFSTNILSEYFTQDLQIRSDHVGELILTNYYLKDQNLLQIRIQQINHLHIDKTNIKLPFKAHFSGQTSNSCEKYHWTNTSSFIISSLSSSRINQELNLTVYSKNENHIECHLRLHLHTSNQIHSHARWQHSLKSNTPTTITVPLVVL
ncbi:unnamed protein product [Adineta steineri]|uniref:C2 domain-containing protein n=1 Tax=Adineta steineri TaxID=433720 RepID=A0A818TVK8_9BILA|nr:unnamed protein product [Adineta steineri]CAF3684450.1 unnamed protein product [Adineta steineri]